jgi:hypothetical protein
VCVCVCVYIYIHIYRYIHTYIYIYVLIITVSLYIYINTVAIVRPDAKHHDKRIGTQFTCFAGTKVQILTLRCAPVEISRVQRKGPADLCGLLSGRACALRLMPYAL